MQVVGTGHRLTAHAKVREETGKYVIELDVAGFTEPELSIGAVGRVVTVLGDQLETAGDDGAPLRLHERLVETFRLPDDAVPERIKAFHKQGTLEIHAPRARLEPHRIAIEHPKYRINPDAAPC
jgi:HSP20 family molecular chaperone IbpA